MEGIAILYNLFLGLDYFSRYLVIINIIGLASFIINTLLYNFTAEMQIDKVLTILSLLGGSFGIILGILLFDRKPVKDNMMSRVFITCVFVIQVVLFLFAKGFHAETINYKFWEFFDDNKIILIYLVVINVVAIILFALDKINAIEGRSRIRIVTLLGIAFMGGSVGALIAMYTFRHKTKIDYFIVGVPMILVMQIVVCFYIMNIR